MSSSLPSLPKRLLQVSCAMVWCLVAAGPVFGFAALKPILIEQGIYKDRCDVTTHDDDPSGVLCTNQDLALNGLFTVACMVTNISALPVGSILDKYGPRITGIIGAAIIMLGSLTLRSSVTFIDTYLCGYTLLALGGPFVFISCFQLANSFPKNSGLILALLTGAFDSSLALFLGYRVIYFGWEPIGLPKFFTYYTVVPVFIFLCQLFIMPAESYKTVGTLAKIAETAIDETGKPLDRDLLLPEDRSDEERAALARDNSFSSLRAGDMYGAQGSLAIASGIQTPTETTQLLQQYAQRRDSVILRASFTSKSSLKSVYEEVAEDRLINKSGGVFGIMHGYTLYEQLKSPWFTLMTLFTTIQMLRINYFVATIKSQEEYLYGSVEVATTINHFFDLALPLGGICSIPFIGLVLDNLTTLTVLSILTVISVTIGVLGLFAWIEGTYIGIILLVLYRPFYYTAVSDFCAKVFGFDTFGTIYGTIICFSGVCNILQQLLDGLTHLTFNMNPTPVNTVLTLLTVVFGGSLLYYVRAQEQTLKRRNLEFEAQDAHAISVPN